jgi:hypothetical protein
MICINSKVKNRWYVLSDGENKGKRLWGIKGKGSSYVNK